MAHDVLVLSNCKNNKHSIMEDRDDGSDEV